MSVRVPDDGGEASAGMDAARLEAVLAAFAPARAGFETLVNGLAADAADAMTAAQLEQFIDTDGREVMRQLLQGHLDLRSIREPKQTEVVGSDAVARRNVERGHTRLLFTLFGTVTVTRLAYRAIGAGNLYLMDACLNLPAERSGHGLRKLAARETARGSFDDAQDAIVRACGTRIGKRQIEQLAVRTAVDVEAYYRAAVPEPCTSNIPMILSMDGKGIVMRTEALREDTRAAAEAKGADKMATRLSPGEKLGRKRMAMLGTVYDTKPAARTVDDVITDPHVPVDQRPERAPGPKAFNKWLTGSVTDNTADVVSAVFDQAEQRDPLHQRVWVVLVDGARAQIEQILAEAAVRSVAIHIVVDFIHVLEYLWKAAWCFHAPGDASAEAFVAGHARAILAGHSAQTVADLHLAAKTGGLPDDKTATIDKVCGYLENKHPYLRYDTALARGWPIATGIIEGACRHLVKDRLDITGARWGLEGAEAILKLRAMISNGDFDTYYAWHLKREFQRVHQTRYRDKLSLAA